ncbi:MAG: RHS repeat-associated core domain-containing protein [Bacteroidales bacterium]|nr:RHS repeat-associated core domain-containing protein [Bacteroidales bacterium]
MCGFGLINMNGRLYDPYLQRFLSPDPFVQSPGNAQNYNRYSYCLNNPLMYTDPSGNFQVPIYNWNYQDLSDPGSGGGVPIWYNSGWTVGINSNMGSISGIRMPTLEERGMGKSTGYSVNVHYGDDAFRVGVAYNNYFNSWKNTAAGSYLVACSAYATGVSADVYAKLANSTCSIDGVYSNPKPNVGIGEKIENFFNGLTDMVNNIADGNFIPLLIAISDGGPMALIAPVGEIGAIEEMGSLINITNQDASKINIICNSGTASEFYKVLNPLWDGTMPEVGYEGFKAANGNRVWIYPAELSNQGQATIKIVSPSGYKIIFRFPDGF